MAVIGTIRYYAIVHDGFTREWPSGLYRRTVIDEQGETADEAWTARGRWEGTLFFRKPAFGDFDGDDVERIEIDETEAEVVRSMLGVRPRGGPFTAAGQAWLREHPDEPGAPSPSVTSGTSRPPAGGSYYGYRGVIYPAVTVAKEWVGLPADQGADGFPDALEVHDGPGRAWVKIPRTALDAAFTRTVHARWHGVPVVVGGTVARGPAQGRVTVVYEGSDPAEAVAAGLLGDQYNGWAAEVDPAEIDVVADEMVSRPIIP
jgi:hypothetical protein